MKILRLMYGVPNSGKSHKARRLAPAEHVYSTDDYFVNGNPGDRSPGGYKANWHFTKLGLAHKWNQGNVRRALAAGTPVVVVDNTNLKRRDAATYAKMASEFGYDVEIHESDAPWWLEIRLLLKDKEGNRPALEAWALKLSEGFLHDGVRIGNDHGVPRDTILRMLLDMENYTVADLLG
ncbi:MAG: AAA family ATPase [Minisyncoccia bacterium]